MNKSMLTSYHFKGWTEHRLFDSKKLSEAKALIMKGVSKEEADRLMKWAAKPIFKGNFLWKKLKQYFNVDLAIPYLTGVFTLDPIRMNLVTTKGKELVVKQLGGTTATPVTAIAIGVGTVAAAAGDTALGSESTTNGAARGAATVTNVTTTTTNDTEQWLKTFTFTGSFAITEEGLFDNNASAGNMLARQVFSAINVVSGDSLQITHKVQAT